MKLKNILIVVDNIEESIHFYNELFGLNVISVSYTHLTLPTNSRV